MGRPRTCDCGTCAKCKRRIRGSFRYQSLTMDERRALIGRRDPEKVRAADRARYERDKPKRLAAMHTYQQAHPEAHREALSRWAERNPVQARANWTASNAIRDGRLTRQPCEVCGAEPAQAHHDDYALPLDVRWLCPAHHVLHHHPDSLIAVAS